MNICKKPSIRFQGFEEKWEEKKLSNLCSMHARIGWQNLRTSEFLDSGEYYLITGTDFVDGKVNWETCHYVARERYEQDTKIQVKNGSILVTKDGTLGKVAFVENLYKPATLNAGVFNVKIITDSVDNKYLYQYLKAPFLMSYVDKKATGGTIKHLNQNILVDFPVWLSKYEEQELIGNFFSNLDSLLSLRKQKLEKLQNFKCSCLEKMFPKDGCSVPELRFDGFEGEWEKKKLGEVFEEYSEKNHPNLSALTVIQGGGTVRRDESNRSLQYDKNSLNNYKMVREGDFIVHLRSFEGGFELSSNIGLISPAYHTLHGAGTDSRFYYAYFRSENFINVQLKPHVYGIRDGRSIDIEGMKNILIPCPTLAEQQKIGDFLESVNGLIKLEQVELEKLENLKKVYLEKMFV